MIEKTYSIVYPINGIIYCTTRAESLAGAIEKALAKDYDDVVDINWDVDMDGAINVEEVE